MMLTHQQIIDRLLEYHEEVNPDTIGQTAFDRVFSEGYSDPCGCALCQLMQDLQIEIIQEMNVERTV